MDNWDFPGAFNMYHCLYDHHTDEEGTHFMKSVQDPQPSQIHDHTRPLQDLI